MASQGTPIEDLTGVMDDRDGWRVRELRLDDDKPFLHKQEP